MKNKKGQFGVSSTLPFMIIALVLTLMLGAGTAFSMSYYRVALLTTPEKMDTQLLAHRFTAIPECFAYQDPLTGRVYPGVIDKTKLTQNQLAGCYQTSTIEEANFRLHFEKSNVQLKTKRYFTGADLFTITRQVQIKNGDQIEQDILRIFVQKG